MFQGWRLKLREAEEAFQQGKLEEAARRVRDDRLDRYRPGRKLAAQVADGLAQRARGLFNRGEQDRAWQQLEQAREWIGDQETLAQVRQELVDAALLTAEEQLNNNCPMQALSQLESLARRRLGGEPRSRLEEVARRIESARNLARHARFAEADSQLEFAGQLRPDLRIVNQLRTENQRLWDECRALDKQLHEALQNRHWNDALSTAESLLNLAPEHRIAEDARRKAWAEVGAHVGGAPPKPGRAAASTRSVASHDTQVNDETSVSHPAAWNERFLLWVDAVGGYLVCLKSESVIGQSGAVGVDIPLLADLSRQHARIRREDDTYVLEPLQATRVNGRRITGAEPLEDGDEIQLGKSVTLRFRRPHPLSATARLEFISRHRTQPSADAVLLMAESCVLGPRTENHVVCRQWERDLVMFRSEAGLSCRSLATIEVDGLRSDGPTPLQPDSRVVGDDFSLSVEPL